MAGHGKKVPLKGFKVILFLARFIFSAKYFILMLNIKCQSLKLTKSNLKQYVAIFYITHYEKLEER